MSIVSVQGLLAYSANCTFRTTETCDKFVSSSRRNRSIYMSFQLIKTWVNKSIVRYILVRKTCAHVFIKQLYFFIYFVHKKKEILRKKYWCCTCIGVRTGGARGAAAPPNFGQLRFFGQREIIWAKSVFKDVTMFIYLFILKT